MTHYILIQPDEDGNPITWLDPNETNNIKQLMEDYGVEKFLSSLPKNNDPNYWEEGSAILLKVEICKVKPKKVVEQYVIEGKEE